MNHRSAFVTWRHYLRIVLNGGPHRRNSFNAEEGAAFRVDADHNVVGRYRLRMWFCRAAQRILLRREQRERRPTHA